MLTGKDRGKQGRILDARPRDGKVIVENLNLMTKHQKPRPIRDASRMGGTQIAPGGRSSSLPSAVAVSNVMLVCPTCKLPTRVGYRFKEGKDGDRQGARLQARRLRPGDRQVMAATETYTPAPQAALQRRAPRRSCSEQLELAVDHAVADGRRRSRSTWASARARPTRSRSTRPLEELTIIAGQRAQVRRRASRSRSSRSARACRSASR